MCFCSVNALSTKENYFSDAIIINAGICNDINTINWIINDVSDFDWIVCSRVAKEKTDAIEIGKLSQGLRCLQKRWLFHLSGGEPFLENNIIEIYKEITKKHYISLDTKFSTENLYRFADSVNHARCLFINAEINIAEREKCDNNFGDYFKKYKYLKKKGFNIIACYIAHPYLLDRLESDIEFLKFNGVGKVRIKIFRPKHKKQKNSSALDNKEQIVIQKRLEGYCPEFEMMNKPHKYFNNICLSGQKFLIMDRNGNLKRCSSTLTKYGNLFDRTIKQDLFAKPCPINECGYPYEGIQNIISSKGTYTVALKNNLFERYFKAIKIITNLKERIVEIFD